jgi:hypothetical protein
MVSGSEEEVGRGGYRELESHVLGGRERWWGLGIGWRSRGASAGRGRRMLGVQAKKDLCGVKISERLGEHLFHGFGIAGLFIWKGTQMMLHN